MRVKNLFIIVAIIAAVWLVIRYFYQVRNLRRGYNRVSGGRVFLNWFLAIVLVVSLVGVGMTSFAAHRTEGVTPSKTSTKSVSPAKSNSDNDNDEVVLKFKKSARLDENEEARGQIPDFTADKGGHQGAPQWRSLYDFQVRQGKPVGHAFVYL